MGNGKINQKVIESYRLPFDAKISVGTALHDRLIQEAGCESVVICNGVEECFLKSTENDKSKENITIGFPYREPKVKNCDMGMRVLLKLKEKYPSIELLSFGFKKPQVWDERIRFVENPSREALVDLYGQMDIFMCQVSMRAGASGNGGNGAGLLRCSRKFRSDSRNW